MSSEYKFRATNIDTNEQWEFDSSSSDYTYAVGSAKRKASRQWPDSDIDLALFDAFDTNKYRTHHEKRNSKWEDAWRPNEIYNCRATNLQTGEQFVDRVASVRGAKSVASRQYLNSDIHIAWFDEYAAIYEPEKNWISYTKLNGKWKLSTDAELVGMLVRQENVQSRWFTLASDDKSKASDNNESRELDGSEIWKEINPNDVIVLDTETTGFDKKAEICEIAMISGNGEVLLNTLVKPTRKIPSVTTNIHGITNEMVARAPAWSKIQEKFDKISKGKTVYIYNAEYDLRLIYQSILAQDDDWLLRWVKSKGDNNFLPDTECVMLEYAKYKKDRSNRRKGYKWHKLEDAARQCNIQVDEKHRALADCKTTLGVMWHMRVFNEHVSYPATKTKPPSKSKSIGTRVAVISAIIFTILYIAS